MEVRLTGHLFRDSEQEIIYHLELLIKTLEGLEFGYSAVNALAPRRTYFFRRSAPKTKYVARNCTPVRYAPVESFAPGIINLKKQFAPGTKNGPSQYWAS
jgi:hypothetical protein